MNERTETSLREHLQSVDVANVPPVADVASRVARFEHRILRRRRALAATSSIAAAALVVGVVWNTTAGTQRITGADGVASTTVAPAITDVPTSTSPIDTGPWAPIPVGPAPISGAIVVWTGSEAMMIGGIYEDGSPSGIHAYNPSSLTWSFVVSALPIGDNPLVFWSGSKLVAIGSDDAELTIYEPAVAALRVGEQSPIARGAVNADVPWVWTGSELLVWPTALETASIRIPRAFDPSTSLWRNLSVSPLQARLNAASIWTGSEWIVWGGSSGSTYFSDGAAYNPTTDTWRLLAESPLSARQPPAVWTGTEMIIAAGFNSSALADGAAYDPVTDSWRKIASGLAHPGFTPVWTGEIFILFAKGGAVWYNPTTDQWSSGDFDWGDVSHLDQYPVWTGEVVLLLGSYDSTTGGATFTPPTT